MVGVFLYGGFSFVEGTAKGVRGKFEQKVTSGPQAEY